MELRDFIVTPIIIILVYTVAYFIRPMLTNQDTRRYYFPALTLKIVGALALGFIYQFYYNGGDTFAYHTYGSRPLWEMIMESPVEGLQALFMNGSFDGEFWIISDKVWFWKDPSSFFIVRIATLFDLITFSSYSGTAVLFATLSFIGGWMLYLAFYNIHPYAHKILAFCCLFVPSVIFWGSGILKDTVTLAFVGISTFCIYRLMIERKFNIKAIGLLLLSFFIIFSVKKYILIGLIGGLIPWIFSNFIFEIRSYILRFLLIPLVGFVCLALTFFSIESVVKNDSKYSFEKLAKTSMITAYDIRYGWGARSGLGSGYTLGKLDGSWESMFKLAPQAINVSLFRPYFWEISNPLMILSAIESFITMFFTIYVFFRVGSLVFKYIKAEVLFCIIFSLIFAFGVGVSTFNFGTLSRYRIPLLPFYWSALAIIYAAWKQDKLKSKEEI
jgi:hypothetical protein